MKYRIVLFILFLPFFSMGQTGTTWDSLAKVKLNTLLESWTLGVDSTSDAVDMRVYNRFKSLFDLNARIEDGFNVLYQYRNEKAGAYVIDNREKSFDEYAHDVALQVKGIRVDSFRVLEAVTTNPNKMIFNVVISMGFQKSRKYILPDNFTTEVRNSRRRLQFEKNADKDTMVTRLDEKVNSSQDSVYRFMLNDTLQVAMAFDADTVRITNIRSRTGNLVSINDADLDAVLDGEDTDETKFGDFTAKGRPDYDLDGIANEEDKCPNTFGGKENKGCPASYFITKNQMEFFIGLQLNQQNITLPELNQLGYVDQAGNDAMDVLQSKRGVLKGPASVAGIFAGGSYTYYFGQHRKRIGVSVGFTYAKFSADYELTDPIVYTYKAFDGVNFYRRQITVNRLKEELDQTVFNIPVMFAYRFRLDSKDKSVLSLKAGPSYLLLNTTSAYNTTIDFGGLYQIDPSEKNKITYYDFFDPASRYNIYFTSAAINSGNHPASADSIFQQLARKGYDFANNKTFAGTQDIRRSAFAFNLAVDLQHKISEDVALKAGAQLVYALSMKQKEKYKPVDRTTDAFQSMYNGNNKPSYKAVGLSVGFVYNF